jgi:hypothetical protein
LRSRIAARTPYITSDGYMKAMVSTFDGGALKKK